MNRTRVTRGLAAALLLAAGMSGLGGATPFGTIPSALAAYPVSFGPQATYAVGTGPVGVAIGDFNGDGHPDLAVANYGDNTVSVLLSTSKPTAAPVSRFMVSHTGRGLLFHWRLASASGHCRLHASGAWPAGDEPPDPDSRQSGVPGHGPHVSCRSLHLASALQQWPHGHGPSAWASVI